MNTSRFQQALGHNEEDNAPLMLSSAKNPRPPQWNSKHNQLFWGRSLLETVGRRYNLRDQPTTEMPSAVVKCVHLRLFCRAPYPSPILRQRVDASREALLVDRPLVRQGPHRPLRSPTLVDVLTELLVHGNCIPAIARSTGPNLRHHDSALEVLVDSHEPSFAAQVGDLRWVLLRVARQTLGEALGHRRASHSQGVSSPRTNNAHRGQADQLMSQLHIHRNVNVRGAAR